MTTVGLHDAVRALADPQDRGRQYLASRLQSLVGTRMAGFVLARQEAAGRWGVATYALRRTDSGAAPAEGQEHRDHGGAGTAAGVPKTPMPPMPETAGGTGVYEGEL